ncbi:MAG: hypothetical protein K2X93_07295, partial [Candidatus Obscuribacterales bacterium]|nr:hypothetical protein [Candidatus Obscuribacterales bacterium]
MREGHRGSWTLEPWQLALSWQFVFAPIFLLLNLFQSAVFQSLEQRHFDPLLTGSVSGAFNDFTVATILLFVGAIAGAL